MTGGGTPGEDRTAGGESRADARADTPNDSLDGSLDDSLDNSLDDSLDGALRLDFLVRFLADQDSGQVRTLDEYVALYPGHRKTIVEAYSIATSPIDDPTAASPRGIPPHIGPYRPLRELGRGGQAIVWLARDDRLERNVALKTVPLSPIFSELAPRFRREALLTATLTHPGICPIFDVGADDRVAWIAMRHVTGETLASRLAAATEPWTIQSALVIAERVALALHAAHEAGVVHRDVKPGNIMLTENDEPVVLDFGIALDERGETLTLTGEALGTPSYMAPEALDPRGRTCDRRVDVYALGVTLYEMLTRRRPFDAPTRHALVRAILDDEPIDPRRVNPKIPSDLSIVVSTALEKDPDRRYRTAVEFAADLRRVRNREPIAARPLGPLQRARRFAQRNPALTAALLALFLALTSGFAISLRLLDDAKTALSAKDLALDRFLRLADLRRAADLLAREREAWPAIPEKLPTLRAWHAEASTLIGRAPEHRASFESTDPQRADVAEAWLRDQTEQLLAAIDRVAAAAESVDRRITFASEVDRRTIDDHAEGWRAAAARVARDPRFRSDFQLAPQRGLIPLGPDPRSGLEEFACLASGAPPHRDETGELELAADSALVFVLIPGGETRIGATPTREDRDDDAHVDPDAGPYDGPLLELVLDPYFLAKHEMTQAQWFAHTGENPATYQRGSKFVTEDVAGRHPVETISWDRCFEVMRQLDLVLPTEAQWENAARAGTTTPFWAGTDRATLDQCDNLADLPSKARGGHESWPYEAELDDGFVAHAPVGRFEPNGFGLHDLHGNVREWCRDTWEDWATYPPRSGDGLATGVETSRTFRGGSFASDATNSRLARRDGLPPHLSQFTLGVRPAREVRPASR